MNMQAMLKQAQKLQKDMMREQEEIKNNEYIGTSSIVTVKAKGNKEIVEVKIKEENLDLSDLEMLEDMIMIAVNDCMKQIDNDTEKKLGKFTQGMPGLF